MSTRIAFVHTSPAALSPTQPAYSGWALDFQPQHLLEDPTLRFFFATQCGQYKQRVSVRVLSSLALSSSAVREALGQ